MMCDECTTAWTSWLDYKIPRTTINIHNVDDSHRGVIDRRKTRTQAWADLIRFQQNLIKDICTRNHQPTPA